MLVQGGKISALAVVAVILAQTLCPTHLMPAAAAGITAQPEQSSCHPSFPSTPVPRTPTTPNSGQRCCVSPHHPEAILATRYSPTVPMTTSTVRSMPLLSFTVASSDPANNAVVVS